MLRLHRKRWSGWVAVAALASGIAIASQWPAPSLPPTPPVESSAQDFAREMFANLGSSYPHPRTTGDDLIRVLVLDNQAVAVPGADVLCHDYHTRTDASGGADCYVDAESTDWPVMVSAVRDNAFGQARGAGHGATAIVVLRPPVSGSAKITGIGPFDDVVIDVYGAIWTLRVTPSEGRYTLPTHVATRTYFRVLRRPLFGGEPLVVGSGVSEKGEAVDLQLGAPGEVRFSALDDHAQPLVDPVVYVDRYRQSPTFAAGAHTLTLPPGEHVLVLNQSGSRARHELKFRVRSDTTTDLGALRLEEGGSLQ